uniref:Malignant fibrous histiocytoma-amplified sequence 1 homolog n=1 Tax=Saccoglossus kowalevskii TaxID=10224 RepID=A0ABM0MJW5_SACKO|nr:PREDICTED: malignant fibrous histiocytoma-amplified sequence 1 homolog [Saccoglossus kowalevskii]
MGSAASKNKKNVDEPSPKYEVNNKGLQAIPDELFEDDDRQQTEDIFGIESAKYLHHLDVSENKFRSLSDELFTLPRLKHLLVASNMLVHIPETINRVQLFSLDWSKNGVTVVEERILTGQPKLKTLKLGSMCSLDSSVSLSIPHNLGNLLKSVEYLDISNNHLDIDISEQEEGILETICLMNRLTHLNVEGNNIKCIPSTINNLTQLQHCLLQINELKTLPVLVLRSLKHFNLDHNSLGDVTVVHFNKMKLGYLSVRYNEIEILPVSLAQPYLEVLHLDGNKLTDVSNINFKKMVKLKKISLKGNNLESLPTELVNMNCLEIVDAEDNKIESLPSTVSCEQLKEMKLSNNKITKFPDQLSDSKCLEILDLSGNEISDVKNVGDDVDVMENLKTVNLSNNKIVRVPIECLQSPNLVHLDVGGNQLEAVPEVLSLQNLKVLSVENNDLVVVPAAVFQHDNLEVFLAKGNRIHTISNKIPTPEEHCSKIHTFDVSDNRLRSVPRTIQNMENLQKVNVSDNQLYFLPEGLAELESRKATSDMEAPKAQILVGGNLLRDIPETVDKTKPLTEILGHIQQAENRPEPPDLSKIKRGKMFFIGSQGGGKSTLLKNLLSNSVRQPGMFKDTDDKVNNNETDVDKWSNEESFGKIQLGYNGVAFMDSVIWPIADDIDISVTDCSGTTNFQSVYQLFYVPNALYTIIVNLEQYYPITDETFQLHIASWIKDIFTCIGGEFIINIIGTHGDRLTEQQVLEHASFIEERLKKMFNEMKSQLKGDYLVFTSPCKVLHNQYTTSGFEGKSAIKYCEQQLLDTVQNPDNRLLPIDDQSLFKDNKPPSITKMLRFEKLLVNKKEDHDPLTRVRLTYSEFEAIGKKSGLKTHEVDDAIEYMRRVGVVQYYSKIYSLNEYIFHNLDFLTDILQTFLGKDQKDLLNQNNFPHGYRDITFGVVRQAFTQKAILSEDVIRDCIINHLELDEDAVKLVLDVLVGFGICYDVSPEGNNESFLHVLEDHEAPPRVVRFPMFLTSTMKLPVNFMPVFETKLAFPWVFPKRLMSEFVCMIHKYVKKEWKDGFHCEIKGTPVVVMVQKPRGQSSKSLVIQTQLKTDLGKTFDVLNDDVIGRLRDLIRNKWPHLRFNNHLRVICPRDTGCREELNMAAHGQWKVFPRELSEVQTMMDDCEYRKEGREVNVAVDIVVEKLKPEKWKLLAPNLGIPLTTVKSIDEESMDDKQKLWKLLHMWKDKYKSSDAIIKMSREKMINALRVHGENSLAEELEHLGIDSWGSVSSN